MAAICTECSREYKRRVPHQLTCCDACGVRRNKRLRSEREAKLGVKTPKKKRLGYAQIPKKCQTCGKGFLAKSERNVYCSIECRAKNKELRKSDRPLKGIKLEIRRRSKIYRPKKIKSHCPELQKALDAYTKRRGTVERFETPDYDQRLLSESERNLIQQLSTIDWNAV